MAVCRWDESAVSLLGACEDTQVPPTLLGHVSVQAAWSNAMLQSPIHVQVAQGYALNR